MLNFLAIGDFFALCRSETNRLQQNIASDVQITTSHNIVDHAHTFKERQVLKGARDAHFGNLTTIHMTKGLAPKRD